MTHLLGTIMVVSGTLWMFLSAAQAGDGGTSTEVVLLQRVFTVGGWGLLATVGVHAIRQ